jgi:hypothetical protein
VVGTGAREDRPVLTKKSVSPMNSSPACSWISSTTIVFRKNTSAASSASRVASTRALASCRREMVSAWWAPWRLRAEWPAGLLLGRMYR